MSILPLQMPERIELDTTSATETFGRFIIQPLEEGYGATVGNSFRRVLLSSIPGASITAVQISGVQHEFQTLKGVVEDVAEIILNLKEVRIKPLAKKNTTVALTISGAKEFLAGDIQKASTDIEVLNPKHHIATLNKEAKFDIELSIGRGRGYVPADEQSFEEKPIGMIAIDSIFTPVKTARYTVEPTRVGQKTDYERLIIEIETDGSIAPQDALVSAARILDEHVRLFLNFSSEEDAEAQASSEEDQETVRVRRILTTNVDELELSVRSHNCLKAANIKTIGELVRRNEAELLKFRNFGRKSLSELGQIVENYGLNFGMDVDKYLKEKN